MHLRSFIKVQNGNNFWGMLKFLNISGDMSDIFGMF